MSRRFSSPICWLLCLLMAFTGCAPTQPFFLHEDGDLSHYLGAVQEIEYADVKTQTSPQAEHSRAPITLSNMEFAEFWDLSLEEAISIALKNSDVIRNLAQVQTFGQNRVSATNVLGATTINDPAVTATGSAPAPQTVDGNGNRLLPRGAANLNPGQGVEDALAEFDAQRFSTFSYNITDRPRNVGPGNIFNPEQFRARDSGFLSALSKRTASGGVWTARTRTDYSQNNIPTFFRPDGTIDPRFVGRSVPSDWTVVAEGEWTYPLLRNRGVQINRIPVVLARLNEDIAVDQLEQQVRNLVMDVETVYWQLYCAYRLYDVNVLGRDAAQEAWDADRLRRGKRDPGEQEARTREQFSFFQGQVQNSFAGSTIQNEEGILGWEGRLRYLLKLEATDGALIRPSDEPTLARVEFDWDTAKTEALYRSPELRQQKRRIVQREMELISAKNQLLPELNLSMGYRFVGVGDNLYNNGSRNGISFPNPGSSAIEELTGGQYTEAFFNLTYLPPAVGKRRQKLGVRNAQLQLVNETNRLETMEINVAHQLTDTVRALDALHHAAEVALAQLKAADDEVRSLQAKERQVERVYDQLLDAQRRRANSMTTYWRSVCEYNRQIALVHFVKGSLLEHNAIHLAEGPWPKKAYWDAVERARERDASTYLDYGFTRPRVIGGAPVQDDLQYAAPPSGIPSLGEGELEMLPSGIDNEPSLAPAPPPASPPSAEPLPDPDDTPPTGPTSRLHVDPELNAPRRAAFQSPTATNPLR